MAYVNSLSELIEYIKERLGEPVIRVEVHEKQIRHAINRTVDTFIEHADDGTNLMFKTINVEAGTRSYTMDEDVHSIRDVYNTTEYKFDAVFPGRLLADQYGMHLTKTGGLFTLELARQEIETINFYLRIKEIFNYNTTTKKLTFIQIPITSMQMGILYYEYVDKTDTSPIYDHHWIRDYSTALTKYQWGQNLTKYTGSMLPGGLTTDAQTILTEAKEEIEKLETELREELSLPVDFFIG